MESKTGQRRESGHEPEMCNIDRIEVVSIEKRNYSGSNRISNIWSRPIRSIAVCGDSILSVCSGILD